MVVFRLGFADSIDHSRKLIKGGDIWVNNGVLAHPNAVIKAGWTIKNKSEGAAFNLITL
jgi:ribosomal protein S4